jgi:hypothetical protein
MRKLSLLLSLLFCSVVAFTQKIDLDKLNFKASYLQLPTNPFPEEYTTFSTKFIANGINLSDAGFANGESDLASTYFNISGFKKVNMGGHFTIKVQIDGYDMGKPETVKKETTTKDKDGKETTTVSYTLKFKYLVPMMYTITDLNGKILKDGPIAEGFIEKTYETSSYSTTAALEKYWNDNAATTKRGLLGGFISEKLSIFQALLDGEIGYVPRANSTDILWTTDSPKHPENDAFKKACEDTRLAMREMTVTMPLNPSKVKPIIAYFDSVLVKYTKDEKPERKLRYAAWYNMATIYFWLEDFDNAVRCSEGLIANDYDKNDGKEIKSGSEKLKAKLANGRFKTRHYVRDVSNAVAPEMTQAQKDEEVARQNALKDKAMREAAEREVASQRRTSSSGSNGMLDLDKSINAIGNLLGSRKKKESNIVFDQPIAELVNAMNETLWNYQIIMKSMSLKLCPNNATVEMLGQFDSFKKQFETQKNKLDKSTVTKIRTLVSSYEIFMEKEVMASYIIPSNPEKVQQIMASAISMLKEQNSKALNNLTNENDDKNIILLLLSELQKSLNYGSFPLYSEEDCNQQAYDLAKISFKRLSVLEGQSKLSPEINSELKILLAQYSPLFQSEKSKIKEAQNIKLIESINKNEYPKFVLNLLQN